MSWHLFKKRILSLPNSVFSLVISHLLGSFDFFCFIFINNFGDLTPTRLRRSKLKIHQGNKWFLWGFEITALLLPVQVFHGVLLFGSELAVFWLKIISENDLWRSRDIVMNIAVIYERFAVSGCLFLVYLC